MELDNLPMIAKQKAIDIERKFQLVLDSVPSGIVMVDSDGRIVLTNSEIEKMFGYDSSELLGKQIEILVPMRMKPKHKQYRSDFIAHPAKRQMGAGRDLRGIKKDGCEIPVEIGLNHLQAAGETFVIATVVDITARKSFEERLSQVYREIQQKNEEMEQFVYTVSHDLKAPLVTSMAFLGFLKEDLTAGKYDDVTDSLARLEKAYRKMQELIDDLLKLSRVGRIEVQLERLPLNDVFTNILEYLGESLEKKKIEFRLPADLPTITADRKRVHQIFENLITNAIKYASDVPHPRIEIIWNKTNTETQICVKDNGPGIEKQFHKKIFGLFQRLQTSHEGTGVGLAIVSRAMQLHNGRAWVESEPGHGAAFWVAFPDRELPTSESGGKST
jgi:hypothetical protein